MGGLIPAKKHANLTTIWIFPREINFSRKKYFFFFGECSQHFLLEEAGYKMCVTRRVSNNVALLLKRGIALHSGLKDLREKKLPKILVLLTVL